MHIRVAKEDSRDYPYSPFTLRSAVDDIEGDEEWQCPYLLKHTCERKLAGVVREKGDSDHGDDVADLGRYDEEIGLEGVEAEAAEGEGEVAAWRI